MELEAVLAVYGDDCAILDSFPPHLHLHGKPRTVDISSQQEVVEKLPVMNHRDGDCPLCLYPLVPDDEQHEALAFMKLMS